MKKFTMIVYLILSTVSSRAEEMFSYSETDLAKVINVHLKSYIGQYSEPTPGTFYDLERALLDSAAEMYNACAIGAGLNPIRDMRETYDTLVIKEMKFEGVFNNEVVIKIRYKIDNGSIPVIIESKLKAEVATSSYLVNMDDYSKSYKIVSVLEESAFNSFMNFGEVGLLDIFSVDERSISCSSLD